MNLNNIDDTQIINFEEIQEALEKQENDDKIDTTTNCLALTVRENYSILVVKNFFKKSARISWKVALSIFAINFLNMFL